MRWWRALPGLKAGDRAPEFEAQDEEGAGHSLAAYRGRWLVLFFYPMDNTPVCVKEACAFNDDWEQFQELGADILGCSGQDAASHRKMREVCRLRYRLLCDVDGSIRERWGVPLRFLWKDARTTFLVDPEGVVRFVFSDPLRGEEHAAQTLAFLKRGLLGRD